MKSPPPKQHQATLPIEEFPAFLRQLDAYDGEPTTRLALSFIILTIVRTKELRAAKWREFENLEGDALWRIPPERMKMRREHLVPLPRQAVAVLRTLRPLTGWSKRRHPKGQDDPSGSITSQTSRGFTGHEQLDEVGLIHMNGRVYDPLIGRFGTPDPMTESPYSTQGWNRYSYVGNSPLNFTDPSGYCFMGCFWQKPFKALGSLLRRVPILGNILQVAASAICVASVVCAPFAPAIAGLSSAVVTGLASGDLGQALKAGLISAVTAYAFSAVGDITGHRPTFGTSNHFANIAGHAARAE